MADETTVKATAETDGDVKTWKRRGLLAATWAAVAAIVAKQTTPSVEAANGDPVVLGATNTETAPTSITNNTAGSTALTLTSVAGPFGVGVSAQGAGYGVIANSFGLGGSGAAVSGIMLGTGPSCYGVYGANPSGAAVYGQSMGVGETTNGIGVLGQTLIGTAAVRGEIPSISSSNSIAVYGLNYSTYTGPGPGAGGFAVFGLSANGHGLVGAAATAGAGAIVGATNGMAGAYAGLFYGPVIVSGAFTVLGAKSAAVPHPDGSHRLLYCMESPESWFEDFGESTLACGQAEIALDADFAAVTDTEKYHVFLTQYAEHNDLARPSERPRDSGVKAKDAASSGAFSWRVVAKRKDIVGERLAKVTIPSEPVLLTEPPMREAPTPPDFRSRMVRQ